MRQTENPRHKSASHDLPHGDFVAGSTEAAHGGAFSRALPLPRMFREGLKADAGIVLKPSGSAPNIPFFERGARSSRENRGRLGGCRRPLLGFTVGIVRSPFECRPRRDRAADVPSGVSNPIGGVPSFVRRVSPRSKGRSSCPHRCFRD
jgi:hypothetical protein